MMGDILDSRGLRVFQEILTETGAAIPSMRKKSMWKTQSIAEKGNGQEKLPPIPFPCPGQRQDLDTEAQNT